MNGKSLGTNILTKGQIKEVADGLFKAFMGLNNNLHLIGISRKLRRNEFDNNGLVATFIEEIINMERCSVYDFNESKMEINISRINKVNEDKSISLKKIQNAEKSFDFI